MPKILALFLFTFLLLPKTVNAATNNAFVTIVNPVRGNEFWSLKDQQPTTNIQQSYSIIKQNQLQATWLLRFDALTDQAILKEVRGMDVGQEIGIFLEITPQLAQRAQVTYNAGPTWHAAGSVFLTGYSQEDRRKLIDALVAQYRQVFSKNPAAVGAWWIDGYSLSYLKEKYNIQAAMVVADQYTTDNYQIWGQYWSTPYYPSKANALMPAENDDRKLDVPTIQWATRDPFNAYGNGVFDSTYSVQANDYIPYHSLGIDYFEKLLGVYLHPALGKLGQVTVGLENDFSWQKFGGEYTKQLQLLANLAKRRELSIVTMSSFATAFREQIGPQNTPQYVIAKNPLGGAGNVVWYMSPYYRVGWFYNDKGSVIRDMRLYFDHKEELCLLKACNELNFAYSDSKALDEVTFGENWVLDEGEVKDISIEPQDDNVRITYKNSIGNTREIVFKPHDVSVDGKSQSASEAIIKAVDVFHLSDKRIPPPHESFSSPWFGIAKGLLQYLLILVALIYLPARTILKLLRIYIEDQFFIAVVLAVGISLFTILSLLFGIMHLNGFFVAPLAILAIYGVVKYPVRTMQPNQNGESSSLSQIMKKQIRKEDMITVALILIGTCFISLAVVKSGMPKSYGLGFWGPNGHDAIWHLSLIEALQKQIPPQNPTFAGISLSNYHYFFDLFVAGIAKISSISSLDLLFRFVPVTMALLYGCLIFTLTKRLSNSMVAGWFALFFAYFGGSFGYVITYARDHIFGGETLFWAMQSASFLLNPPFAISVILLLAGLVFLLEWFKNPSKMLLIPLFLLLGVIAQFKVYAAIIIIAGIGLVGLYQLVRHRELKALILAIGLSITNGIALLSNTKITEGLLVFSPFWLIHAMIDSADRVFWERLTLARNSGSMGKLILADAIGLLLFVVGNLGTRVIGFFSFLKNRQNDTHVNYVYTILVIAALVGLLFPLFFIQKATPWNTVQFFYYTILFFDIFAAIALAKVINVLMLRPRPLQLITFIIVAVVLILAVPTNRSVFETYLPDRAPARLSFGELKALTFLKHQPDGIVLTYPTNEKLRLQFQEPIPLFAYTTTAYVSAFSGKPTYFEDEMNNEIIGTDISQRVVGQQEIFKNTNADFDKGFLRKNNIKYIYLPKLLKSHIDEGTYGVKNIYSSDEVVIYEVL